jgi:hypothetical protein
MLSLGIERGRHRTAGNILIDPLGQVGTSLAELGEKYHLGGARRLARRAPATGQDSLFRQRLSGSAAGCCSTLCRHGE